MRAFISASVAGMTGNGWGVGGAGEIGIGASVGTVTLGSDAAGFEAGATGAEGGA